MRRTGVWVCVLEFHHPPNFPWILAAILVCQNTTGFAVLYRGFLFNCFWITVGLEAHTGIGSPQRVSPFYHLFNIWPWHRHRREINSTFDAVVVGEEDELEVDVGWWPSCLEGVIEVEGWELDEELVDKLGTTIGTKFSVLHCIRIPF